MIDGLTYLPMERSLWLQAQCFMNEAEQIFPDLVKLVLFFKENLVSSSLDLNALRPVCRYLFQYPPHKNQAHLEGPASGVLLALSHRSGPVNVAGTQLHMLVFKVGDVMVVFFVKQLGAVEEMQKFVRSGVQALVPELQCSLLASDKADSGYRFVYYNAMNWAIKTAMGGSRRLNRDTLQVISSMHASLEAANEVVARFGSNFVLAKRVDHRELFVIFEGTTSDTLLDVETKTHDITSTILGNIFF